MERRAQLLEPEGGIALVGVLVLEAEQQDAEVVEQGGAVDLVGGVLVYSTEHPIFTARLPDNGWVLDGGGRRTGWSLDRYADEGAREETWFVAGVRKVHRMLATLINGLLDADLVVERVVEPVPSEEWLQAHPLARDERRRPIFLLVRARKAAG